MPPYAALALSVSVPDWQQIGIEPNTAPTKDIEAVCDRVTSVLLVRVVALACPEFHRRPPPPLGTSSICRTALMKQEVSWPEPIAGSIVTKLRQFCRVILGGYNDVPYHR